MTEYVVARSNESNPQGDPWASFSEPAVAPVGTSFDVVFRAGVGGPGYAGVFVERAVTTSAMQPATLITTQDTITVPGLGSNLAITFVGQGTRQAISENGHTVFQINVSPGPNKDVLLAKGPGASDPIRVVSYGGMPFTGTPSGSILVAASPYGITSDGDVGFRATTSTATLNSSGIFRWNSLSSALQLVAHTDQSAVGTNDEFNFIAGQTNHAYAAEFGNSARAAFRATTKDPGMATIGIWLDDPSAGLTHVTDILDVAIGVNPPTFYADFHAPAVSSLGRVAFRGCLLPGCTYDGIWSGMPGSVGLMALQGKFAPGTDGTSSGDLFVNFSNPVLNEDGAIAFRGEAGNYDGLWRFASQFGPVLKRVVKKDDFLRGTSLQFVAFGPDLTISDSGELAFTATMSDREDGLFTTLQIGATSQIVKIAKEGEAFAFTPTVTKMISNVSFYPGAYAMGTSGFIHVQSSPAQPQAVGFTLAFTDGARALVVSTVE